MADEDRSPDIRSVLEPLKQFWHWVSGYAKSCNYQQFTGT